MAATLAASTLIPLSPGPAQARGGDITIKLKNVHTKETGVFTYKRNGRYDKKELSKINHLLRDWRKNQSVNMDPQLLDMIAGVYRETGGKGYIEVICGYRSAGTNKMLRSRSRGVAQNSQHTLGKAIDFYIPGVPLAKLRATAMKIQGGGVGYYPTSGSPFVHMDTGNVRAWPRMSRTQLLALFPKGDTLHLPSDGKPLAGYDRALAQRKSGKNTALAYLDTGETKTKSGGWLKRVFSGGADQVEDDAESGVDTAVTTAPPTRPQAPAAIPAMPVEPAIPALPETVPGETVPAVETPETLLAEVAEPESRVPRARPISDAETAIAVLSGLPAETPEAPESTASFASLAYAPLPRSRPDSSLLADSLGADAAAPQPLDVGSEDAIAALAAQAGAAVPESVPAPPAVATRQTEPPAENAPSESADSIGTLLAYTPAEPEPEAEPQPQLRRLVVAGVGMDLQPRAEKIEIDELAPEGLADPILVAALNVRAAERRAELQGAAESGPVAAEIAKRERIRLAAKQFAAQKQAATGLDEATVPPAQSEAARSVEPATDPASDGFAMPEPSGAPGLFAAPQSPAAIGDAAPRLPAGRFSAPEEESTPSNDSFLSRLFASLAQ